MLPRIGADETLNPHLCSCRTLPIFDIALAHDLAHTMSIGFFLKKVIGTLLMPLPAITILLVVGVGLLWFTRRQRLAKIVVTAAVVLLYLFSLPFIPHAALTSIEGGPHPAPADLNGIEWVVVLSGNAPGAEGYSSVNRVGGPTLVRLIEGIRVFRTIPGARLIVTGGDFEGGYPSARVMREVAVDLGVDPARIIVDDKALDTGQSAENVAEIVGNDRIVLVTSAVHMNRALEEFRAEGLDPIPVRGGYSYTGEIEWTLFTFRPTPGNLAGIEAAWHEFLGSLWSKLTGG